MLSPELSTVVAIIAVFLVVLLGYFYWWMLRLANYCRDAIRFVQSENKRSVSLRRIAEVEATLTELSDSYDALLSSNKKLRARIGMRRTREKRQSGAESSDVPASEAERLEYKAKLRESAKARGLLR